MANDPQLRKKPFTMLDGVTQIEQGEILVLDGQAQNLILGITGEIDPAQGVLTMTAVPIAGETITVGRDIYTWVAAMSSDPATEDKRELRIGVDEVDSAITFQNALNGSAGRGFLYGEGTLRSIHVNALSGGPGVVNLRSRRAGLDGNLIDTLETMASSSFATPTLAGGTDGAYVLEVKSTINGVDWFLHRIVGVDDAVGTNGIITNDVGQWRLDVSAILAVRVDIFSYVSGKIVAEAMTDRMAYA